MLLIIVAFKRTIRKSLNTLAVQIEGIRHPPICLLGTLFSCQCPFMRMDNFAAIIDVILALWLAMLKDNF
jgi:hypothetical protein